MFREVVQAVTPAMEEFEDALGLAEDVLQIYAVLPNELLDAEPLPWDDAIDLLCSGATVRLPRIAPAVRSVLQSAGFPSLEPCEFWTPHSSLYIGSSEAIREIPNVVPGLWSVAFGPVNAVVTEEFEYDPHSGSFERGVDDATGFFGIWSDRSATRSIGPTMDGMSVTTESGEVDVAVHRRDDGRVDAIFFQEQ